jgi:DNA polymerase-3 subunit alpha
VFDQIVDRTLARRREADQGVMSLFGELGGAEAVFDDARVPIPDQEFDKTTKLAFEKEMLGLYLSDHPLKGLEAALVRHTDTTIAELRDQATREASGTVPEAAVGGRGRDGEMRCVGGVITTLVRKYTKRGDLMATFVLEDLESSIEVWVFPRTMTEVGHLLADDAIVCVKGRLDLRDEQPKFICMELKRPDLNARGAEPLHLYLPLHALTDDRVDRLKRLLCDHPGDSPVFMHVGQKCIRLGAEFSVDTTRGLLAELRELLGAGCLNGPGSAAPPV